MLSSHTLISSALDCLWILSSALPQAPRTRRPAVLIAVADDHFHLVIVALRLGDHLLQFLTSFFITHHQKAQEDDWQDVACVAAGSIEPRKFTAPYQSSFMGLGILPLWLFALLYSDFFVREGIYALHSLSSYR